MFDNTEHINNESGGNTKQPEDESMAIKKTPKLIPYIVTTAHRGVFYVEIPEGADITQTMLTNLKDCRMAIRWGTTNGVMQLAETGPTSNSKISAKCDIPVLHGVTAAFLVTPEAQSKWTQL